MARRDVAIRLSLENGEPVRRQMMRIGEDGQKALERIERGGNPASKSLLALNAVTGEFRAGLQGAAAGAGAFGAGLTAMGPAGLAAAAAITVTVGALANLMRSARQAIDDLDQLDDTAQKLGVGAEALQEWRYAFDQNGVSASVLEMGLQRLGRRMGNIARGEGNEYKAALDEIGVSIFATDGHLKSLEEIMPEVADGLAGVTNQSRRLAIAQKLFDSEGVAMVTMLQQGSAELERFRQQARDLGLVMDEHMVAKASETADKLATLQRVVDTQLNEALLDLSPILVTLAESFATVARWVADVVDGFRALEDMSTRGLERRVDDLGAKIAEKNAAIAALEGRLLGGFDQGRKGALVAERDKLQAEQETALAQLMDRRESRNRVKPTTPDVGTNAEADKIKSVTDALRFQLDQLERTEYGKRVFQELQRAGIDADHAEAQGIAALVFQVYQKEKAVEDAKKAEKDHQDLLRKGEQVTKDYLTADEAFQATLRDLKELKDASAISEDTYARAVEDAERRKLEASTNAADGIKRALQTYGKESGDMAKQMESVTTNALKSMEDAFVEMAKTGKLSFRDMVNSILSDLARLLVRKTITGPLSDLIGGLFDGGGGGGGVGDGAVQVAHTGGVVGRSGLATRTASGSLFMGAPRFHTGGLIRPGEVPIIAMKGERVLTEAQQAATARTIEGLAAMAARPAAGVVVNVQNNAGNVAQARARSSWGPGGQLKLDVIVEEIEGTMARKIGRGEGLAPTLEGRYGLNPAAGAYR